MSATFRSTLSAAILAGGESRRMGTDKALLHDSAGEPLLVHLEKYLHQYSRDILIITGGWIRYSNLVFSVQTRVIKDDQPCLGPLGGIATALRFSNHPLLLVAVCDMPKIDQAIQTLLSSPKTPCHTPGTFFPMLLSNTRALQTSLHSYLDQGKRSVEGWLQTISSSAVDVPNAPLENLNTPADVARWRAKER